MVHPKAHRPAPATKNELLWGSQVCSIKIIEVLDVKMKSYKNQIAVVTGGGTGMGRELVLQLTQEGCHVAMCDVNLEKMAETKKLAKEHASSDVRISSHICDVSDEADMLGFRDEVADQHQTDNVNLLFNNAGIGGGGSIVTDENRMEWERTFDICWYGVYFGTRAFLPMLKKSTSGAIVNTSSINGFWATVGSKMPHTAYCAAKFAVKGFTEALNIDLRLHAPHVLAHVVMPGHIGTSIALNTTEMHGGPDIEGVRKILGERGAEISSMSDADIESRVTNSGIRFRDDAPTTAAEAATIIIEGVRSGQWRILVGQDAEIIDLLVREDPESAYEPEFMRRVIDHGHLGGLNRS